MPEPKLLFGELNFTPGAEPWHRGELRSHACQGGGRCAELRGWLVYFARVFLSGGVGKYCSPVPDEAGVVFRAGAKLDLALPSGNDAYLLVRRWVGTADTSSAERGLLLLLLLNKSKSSSATTPSPVLTSWQSQLLLG